jgi:uncharacterized protein (DUF427 family)
MRCVSFFRRLPRSAVIREAPGARSWTVESVWDYPRPPALVACKRRVRVEVAGTVVADSVRAWRVLETSHPPTIYVPAADVRSELLRRVPAVTSVCGFKGLAHYYDVVVDGVEARGAAWSYDEPKRPYSPLAGAMAFYPGRVDAAWLDDEIVAPQPGDFYGGWITADIEGPFKGGPGSSWW